MRFTWIVSIDIYLLTNPFFSRNCESLLSPWNPNVSSMILPFLNTSILGTVSVSCKPRHFKRFASVGFVGSRCIISLETSKFPSALSNALHGLQVDGTPTMTIASPTLCLSSHTILLDITHTPFHHSRTVCTSLREHFPSSFRIDCKLLPAY